MGFDKQQDIDAAGILVLQTYEQAIAENNDVWGIISIDEIESSIPYDVSWGDSHSASVLTEVIMACLSRQKQRL